MVPECFPPTEAHLEQPRKHNFDQLYTAIFEYSHIEPSQL